MKRKTRFNDGGDIAPGDGVQYFDEDALAQARGRDLRAEIAAMQSEGPSSEGMPDSSMRRNLETGEYYSTENLEPKKAVRAAPKAPPIKDVPGSGRGTMAGRRAIDDIMRDAGGGGRGRSMGRTAADVDTFTPGRATGRAEIPVDKSMSGPAKQFSSAMEMSDTGRNISTNLGALGGMGRAVAAAPRAAKVAQTAVESAKAAAAPTARAAKEGIETAIKFGPKAGIDVAKSTAKGIKARAEMQAKRAESGARKTAEAMESATPILQRRPDTKSFRADRTRRSGEDLGKEFSKGGSAASRRADGCAMRGKTRGKIY